LCTRGRYLRLVWILFTGVRGRVILRSWGRENLHPAGPDGPGPHRRQEKGRSALGRGISEGARPNDDQIVVPRRARVHTPKSDFFAESKKYATRHPPPKSRRVAHQPRILSAGAPVSGPWSHGMHQAQYTIRANPSRGPIGPGAPQRPRAVDRGRAELRLNGVLRSSGQDCHPNV
jgi:hypothetical protein